MAWSTLKRPLARIGDPDTDHLYRRAARTRDNLSLRRSQVLRRRGRRSWPDRIQGLSLRRVSDDYRAVRRKDRLHLPRVGIASDNTDYRTWANM
jgi:hypothetical protein